MDEKNNQSWRGRLKSSAVSNSWQREGAWGITIFDHAFRNCFVVNSCECLGASFHLPHCICRWQKTYQWWLFFCFLFSFVAIFQHLIICHSVANQGGFFRNWGATMAGYRSSEWRLQYQCNARMAQRICGVPYWWREDLSKYQQCWQRNKRWWETNVQLSPGDHFP